MTTLKSFNQNFYISFNQNEKLFLKENNFTNESYSFSLNELKGNIVNLKGQQFLELYINGAIPNGKIGNPALPAIMQLIEIPIGSEPEVVIKHFDEEIISLNDYGINVPIVPKQPSLRKDIDPETVPLYKNEQIYKSKDFIQTPIVEVKKSGIARYCQLARLVVSPIQYNPYNNTIKVFKNIEFTINYKNASLAKNIEYKKKYFSPLFEVFFGKHILNYKNILKDQITQYPISYLIISDRMFENTLQPFISWKTRQGYKVTVAYTDVIGSTTTAIKNYITNIYQNSTPTNPAPTYLLLVGDIQQIPAFNGTAGSHVTDTYYATMDGTNDIIPDIYIGRMSATNTTQLQSILDKTLEYEQYLMPDPSYLQYALMIAGVDAYNAPTYGNGQINYANQYYTNPSNGITAHTYLYGSGSPIVSNSPQAAPAIKQNISDGIGFGNYTAHCSSSGWAGPSVTTSDIPNFTNAHKYGLLIGNCCLSCKFDETECFGEAIIRAQNKGAVAYIGASNSSYWDEDYFYSVGVKSISANPSYDSLNLGFYDRLFHLFNEHPSQWYITASQINYAGNLAVEQTGQNNVYYWEIYHTMGDPSLMPYLGIPSTLYTNYLSSIPLGLNNLNVETEPYSYVGISLNNTWIDAKYTGNSTTVNLDLSSINSPCTLDIVITKQNKIPHIGTIQIIPNNAPFVVYHTSHINDSGIETNGIVEYSEQATLDVTLKNFGMQDANQVEATLSTTNPHITIIDSYENFGNIASNSEVTKYNAFSFTVDTLIQDQEVATFTLTATDQNDTWTSNFQIILNSPVLNATSILVDDANGGNNNGRLDPGENAIIKILTKNQGHSISPIVKGILSTSSNYITVLNSEDSLGQISVNNSLFAEFPIQVSSSAPTGSYVNFTYNVQAGYYSIVKDFTLPVGLILEDFETNNFTRFPWDTANYGDAPWIIYSNGNIFEGNYSARSGVIGNGTWLQNTKSDLRMTINVISADTLSFYKRVSSEQGYDFLQFFVDNNKLDEWSGEIPWSRSAYYLTAGTHQLLWRYTKDYSISQGEDAGFLDFIIFPPINLPTYISTNYDIYKTLIYPNPFNNIINIVFYPTKETSSIIEVYDQLGQIVYKNSTRIIQDSSIISVNLSKLNSGIYYLKISTNNQNQIFKIIKL